MGPVTLLKCEGEDEDLIPILEAATVPEKDPDMETYKINSAFLAFKNHSQKD